MSNLGIFLANPSSWFGLGIRWGLVSRRMARRRGGDKHYYRIDNDNLYRLVGPRHVRLRKPRLSLARGWQVKLSIRRPNPKNNRRTWQRQSRRVEKLSAGGKTIVLMAREQGKAPSAIGENKLLLLSNNSPGGSSSSRWILLSF